MGDTLMAKTKKGERGEGEVNLGLGGVFRGLGNLIDLLSEMAQEGKTELSRTGELKGKELKGVYGFNVKIGLGGTPSVETFGNIRKTREGPVVEEVREPLLDVLDEGDSFRIIAELPGVEAGDVKLDLKDDILTIAAEGKDRKYSKEVLLSSRVQSEPPTMSYRNGILEVRVRKAPTG
jgi:HSP20 family protein